MPSIPTIKLPPPIRLAVRKIVFGPVDSEAARRAARELWSELKIARATWASRKTFRALEGRCDLKIHLGCGADIRPGWVNVDLAVTPPPGFEAAAHPDTQLVAHDLREGLPLAEDSCAAIYSSHFFEHLEYRHGLRLMRDCYRALKPGGIFRLCMPNYRGVFEAYLRHDAEYFRMVDYGLAEPRTRTLGDYMTYSLYQFGEHKCFYDEERFQTVLSDVGFRSAGPSAFRGDIDVDNELRRAYSYYVEAIK